MLDEWEKTNEKSSFRLNRNPPSSLLMKNFRGSDLCEEGFITRGCCSMATSSVIPVIRGIQIIEERSNHVAEFFLKAHNNHDFCGNIN